MSALVAVGRTPEGILVVGYKPNATGQISEEITAAAEELADQAFSFFAEKVKAEIPSVLEANQVALRETAAQAIAEGLQRSDLEARLAKTRRSFAVAMIVSTVVGIVGTAFLTSALTRG